VITERNHFNPCFWTAFWNLVYLDSLRNNKKVKGRPREQELFYLNLKSDKILKDRAKNIFYQKGAGIADLSGENVLDYCVAALPELYTELKEEYGGGFSKFIIYF